MKAPLYYIVIPYVAMFALAYFTARSLTPGKTISHFTTARGRKSRTKVPMGVMDKILIIELVVIVLYIIVDFWVFWHVGAEPSTLTMGFFAVCGGENGFMAWIKTRKEQERMRKWQREDEGNPEDYQEDNTL